MITRAVCFSCSSGDFRSFVPKWVAKQAHAGDLCAILRKANQEVPKENGRVVEVIEWLCWKNCHDFSAILKGELDMIWTYILKDLESIANTSGGNKATKKKAHFNCNSMHFACSQTRVTGSIEMAEIHWDWMLTCWHVDRLIHSLGPTSSCSEKVKKHTANIMERIGNWDCHLMILMLSLMQFACGLHMFALVSHFRSCFHLGPCTRGDRKESNKATRSSFREDVTKWKIRKLCFFFVFFFNFDSASALRSAEQMAALEAKKATSHSWQLVDLLEHDL